MYVSIYACALLMFSSVGIISINKQQLSGVFITEVGALVKVSPHRIRMMGKFKWMHNWDAILG